MHAGAGAAGIGFGGDAGFQAGLQIEDRDGGSWTTLRQTGGQEVGVRERAADVLDDSVGLDLLELDQQRDNDVKQAQLECLLGESPLAANVVGGEEAAPESGQLDVLVWRIDQVEESAALRSAMALPARAGLANIDIVHSFVGLLVHGKSDFDAIENHRSEPIYK